MVKHTFAKTHTCKRNKKKLKNDESLNQTHHYYCERKG